MLREWLWRVGQFRMAVIHGVVIGIGVNIFNVLTGAQSVLRVLAGSVVFAVAYGTLWAVVPWPGWWALSELPPSDRVAVLRAIRAGEPVSDPRLAPSVLAYAEVVIALVRRQQHRQWLLLAFAALALAITVAESITGPAWVAVVFWVCTAISLGLGWRFPRKLERTREKAEAAAGFAADQAGPLS